MNVLRETKLEIGREIDRVFQLEIDTLVKVRESLNGEYANAAELLFACPGKVVFRERFSGMRFRESP